MGKAARILTLTLLLMTILGLMTPTNCSKAIFYVYGSMVCHECEEFSQELRKTFGEDSIVFREIDQNPGNLEQMVSIFEATFPDLKKSDLRTPLTVVVVEGEVKGVILRKVPISLVEDILESPQNLTTIYPDGKLVRKEDAQLSRKIIEIMSGKSIVERRYLSIQQVMLPVLGAAAADSINPCTFSVFTALLLMTMFFRGRSGMVKVGIAFISAVYMAYYLLGLGLIRVFAAFTWLRYVIAVAGIVFGSYEIFTSLSRGFKSPLPRPLYKFTSKLVDQISTKSAVPFAFGIGIIVSFTLLPCSAGPYLVALSLIAELSDLERYLALVIYNIVFVIPLIAILASVGAAAHISKKLKKFRSKRVNLLSMISAVLLILICIWVLLQ